MRRTMVISILAIFALLSFACKKNEGSQASVGAIYGEDGISAADAHNYGYVLRLNASFCTLAEDTGSESDKATWAASMALGERVSAGETRKLTFTDGTVYDFVKIRRDDGREGFAFAAQVAAGGQLAVVVDEKANLFKSPKAVDVTGTIVPQKTLVVYYPETESGGYVEVKGYDASVRQGGYVRLNAISRRDADVQSAILLQTATPLKDTGAEKIKKDALLETALLDYPDSAFHAEIFALANPGAASVIKTEDPNHTSFMMVNDNNVNVRSFPDAATGKVTFTLNRGDEVMITERTVSESVIGGQRGRWYHIDEPVEGWVFGAFLDVLTQENSFELSW